MTMLNIMRGDYSKHTAKELNDVPVTDVTVGKLTRSSRWRGIQHGELVNTLHEVLWDEFRYKPLNETYAVSPNGAALIGGFELGSVPKKARKTAKPTPMLMEGVPQETRYGLGFKHSNDSKSSLTMCVGGSVLMCTNGIVGGSEVWKRRHTTGLNLMDWVKEKIQGLMDRLRGVGGVTSEFTNHQVTDKLHDQTLLRIGREGLLSWRLVGEVDRVWNVIKTEGTALWIPEDQDRKAWDFNSTVWDWYNAFTHIVKEIPPPSQLLTLEKGFRVANSLIPKKAQGDLTF